MSDDKVRLDKWLWAARFFKTRALASEAIQGGKVHLNGARAKPGRAVKAGDRLEITKGPFQFEVTVVELSDRRGPAAEAQRLYEESAESRRRREETAEQRRLQQQAEPVPLRRPDKRERRHIIRFRQGES